MERAVASAPRTSVNCRNGIRKVARPMTITIELAPEIQGHLDEKAAREGKPVDMVAREVLSEALQWEARDREEATAGIRRGLDAGVAGEVRPLSQVIAEARARHGFPASWPADPESA